MSTSLVHNAYRYAYASHIAYNVISKSQHRLQAYAFRHFWNVQETAQTVLFDRAYWLLRTALLRVIPYSGNLHNTNTILIDWASCICFQTYLP